MSLQGYPEMPLRALMCTISVAAAIAVAGPGIADRAIAGEAHAAAMVQVAPSEAVTR
jgi:hypothetical protein